MTMTVTPLRSPSCEGGVATRLSLSARCSTPAATPRDRHRPHTCSLRSHAGVVREEENRIGTKRKGGVEREACVGHLTRLPSTHMLLLLLDDD